MRALCALASLVLIASGAAGCGSSRAGAVSTREEVGTSRSAFESNESVLVTFDIVGAVLTDTDEPGAVRTAIEAQLLYSVGALNGDQSVGRHDRLVLSAIVPTPVQNARAFRVTYHATMPVAWGPDAIPTSYTMKLPSHVSEAELRAFAVKYGRACVDEAAGVVGAPDAARMFLVYRPKRAGCVLDAADVVDVSATSSPTTENTTGKYPEYHRIWEDGALDVVAMFSRSAYSPDEYDYGAAAYQEFVVLLDGFLASRQPDPAQRTAEAPTPSTVRRTATLPDGRVLRVDVAIVGTRLADEGPERDAWFDALTPKADVIVYSGHADLGGNARTLQKKGAFVPGKYVMWVANACDTFAYLDRTLADRRVTLNPDDPTGTKYMDQVSTVVGGYFWTGPPTVMTLIESIVTARDPVPAPKTYREIFARIEPEQGTVVTGEEDNEFTPAMFAAPGARPPGTAVTPPEDGPGAPLPAGATPTPTGDAPSSGHSGCFAASGEAKGDPASLGLALAVTLLLRRRSQPRRAAKTFAIASAPGSATPRSAASGT